MGWRSPTYEPQNAQPDMQACARMGTTKPQTYGHNMPICLRLQRRRHKKAGEPLTVHRLFFIVVTCLLCKNELSMRYVLFCSFPDILNQIRQTPKDTLCMQYAFGAWLGSGSFGKIPRMFQLLSFALFFVPIDASFFTSRNIISYSPCYFFTCK